MKTIIKISLLSLVIGATTASAATKFSKYGEDTNWPGAKIRYYLPSGTLPTMMVKFCNAIDYYQQNTLVSFEEVFKDPSLSPIETFPAISVIEHPWDPAPGVINRSSAKPYLTSPVVMTSPIDLLANDSDWNLRHEILHSLGMVHEQSRYDRDDYVDIDPAEAARDPDAYIKGVFNINNYFSWITGTVPFLMHGSFDHESLMRYYSWMFLKLTDDDLLWHATQSKTFTRDFVILQKDSNTNPFDNMVLNNIDAPSSTSPLKINIPVSGPGNSWYNKNNALFDLIWIPGNLNSGGYLIRHRASSRYLWNNSDGTIYLATEPMARDSLQRRGYWQIQKVSTDPLSSSGEFLIRNVNTGNYLSKAADSSLIASNTSFPWIIKAKNLHDVAKAELSKMDKLGIAINYKAGIQIREFDSTPGTYADNKVVLTNASGMGGKLAAKAPISGVISPEIFMFTKHNCGSNPTEKSTRICIKNAFNDGKLVADPVTNTMGESLLAPPATADVNFSDSRLWELTRTKEGYFLIKNKLTNKYWSKPDESTGLITLVDFSTGNYGKWLIDEYSQNGFSFNKTRSAKCQAALSLPATYPNPGMFPSPL